MNNESNREILEIRVEDIIPNRFQPRLTFDMEALNELANSIKEHGIIQPLVVRRLQDKYEIIAGERRYKAATLIGLSKVPCIVMNLNDNESAEVAVIENIQRKEMTPLEEAKSFKKILDKGYLTQEDLAKRMGKSQSSIANKLRLLNLDEMVQDAILNNKISERHARSILKVENKEDQRKILSEIIEKRLTVRQTDDLIKERYGGGSLMFNNDNMNNTNNNYEPPKMSVPTVNIPINNVTEDVNPQLNLIHGFNNTQNNNVEISNSIPSMFNTPQDNINDINNNKPYNSYEENIHSKAQASKEDIQNIINPSVFSNNNPGINKPPVEIDEPKESVLVDINQIKQNASDINKVEKKADIDSLMTTNAPKNENKFFVDLNYNGGFVDVNNDREKSKGIVDKINKNIELLNLGDKVHKEQEDLGNAYKITIIIDK